MGYLILELLESGLGPEQIIKECYPRLTRQDIEACLHYAGRQIRDAEYVPFATATQ